MHTLKLTKIKAFTLLETLASLTILTVTIIGPLTVIVNSSSYARQTKDTVIATYLAEEPIELLQNQLDSFYIFCNKNPADTACAPLPLSTETASQVAWRVFKGRFSGNPGQPSCYEDQKPSAQIIPGCSFDYSALNDTPTTTPVFYGTEDKTNCPYLVEDVHDVLVSNPLYGQSGQSSSISEQRKTYKCKNATTLGQSTSKPYARSVSIKQAPTFEGLSTGGPSLGQYNDDLLITSKVSFKAYNGVTKTVEVVRFMHARQ